MVHYGVKQSKCFDSYFCIIICLDLTYRDVQYDVLVIQIEVIVTGYQILHDDIHCLKAGFWPVHTSSIRDKDYFFSIKSFFINKFLKNRVTRVIHLIWASILKYRKQAHQNT